MCRVSLSDFCNVSLVSFQLNEAAKRLTIGDSISNSSRTNSPGGGWLNEASCMGTESVGRGITTVFFKPVSHQSCECIGADIGFMLHLRGVSRVAHVE